ncbi:MAG: PVC-type heme-binding CxxCH protein [Cyclobacteriaceae bacterium]
MKSITTLLLFSFLLLISCQKQEAPTIDFDQLSEADRRLPENAHLGMEVAEGLAVGLFASEPMMVNPTNIDVDEKGRVWVCEAYNYRTNLNPDYDHREEGDRILILEDEDGDGKADKSTVFYQGPEINSALGIWVMGNKAIVSCSPNIFVFTDEDQDGKADKKEVLFTGIKGVQHDHGAHAMTFGPDGKLYFNFGNEGYQLLRPDSTLVLDQQGRPIIADGNPYRMGMAFRCNLDGSDVEVLGHNFRNNYELAVDSYGNVWQSDNDDDGNRGVRINYVMEYGNYGFSDEMTGAGWRAKRIGMHEEIPKRHWHLNDPGVVPNLLQTGSGSPCGMAFYEGELLPAIFQNQMIHCEAGHNVVRSYPTQPNGAGYKASIVNLVKGKDNWFRPSDVCAAPDGSLLVSDWYDPGVGGHKMGDPGRGRIYRVAPPGLKYQTSKLNLSTAEDAATALTNPNLSTRFLAWQYLNGLKEEAIPALEKLWQEPNSYQRAQAIWLLGKIPGKEAYYIGEALTDNDPNIRVTGLRLARQVDRANLSDYLSQLAQDKNAQVRREVAIALRYLDHEIAADLWATLASQYDGEDRWYLEALGIASAANPDAFLSAWLDKMGIEWNTPAGRDIVWRVRGKAAQSLLAKLIADPTTTDADLKRYFRAYDFHSSKTADPVMANLLNLDHPLKSEINAYALGQMSQEYVQNSGKVKNVLQSVLPSLKGTPEFLAIVRNQRLTNQSEALLDMGKSGNDPDLAQEATNLVIELNGLDIVKEAIEQGDSQTKKKLLLAVGSNQSKESHDYLESLLPSQDAMMQKAALESLSKTWGGQHRIFAQVKDGTIPEVIKKPAAVLLLGAFNGDIRRQITELLSTSSGASDIELAPIAELVQLNGDLEKGAEIFNQYCNNCHQVQGEGTNYGPSLTEIGSKLAKEAIYGSILHPSAGINFGYEGFTVQLEDGSSATGFISSETEEAITLRMMGGTTKEISRGQVEKMEALDQSLMPEGLHLAMSQQDLVNLVSYLTSLKTNEELAIK